MSEVTTIILLIVGSGGVGGALGVWLSWANDHKRLRNDIEATLRQELREDYSRIRDEYNELRAANRKLRSRVYQLEKFLAERGIPLPKDAEATRG